MQQKFDGKIDITHFEKCNFIRVHFSKINTLFAVLLHGDRKKKLTENGG